MPSDVEIGDTGSKLADELNAQQLLDLRELVIELQNRVKKLEFELTNHQHVISNLSITNMMRRGEQAVQTELTVIFEQSDLTQPGNPDPLTGLEVFGVETVSLKKAQNPTAWKKKRYTNKAKTKVGKTKKSTDDQLLTKLKKTRSYPK